MTELFIGNDLLAWSRALGAACVAVLLALLAKKLAMRALGALAARTASELDDIALAVLAATGKLLYVPIGLYAIVQMLVLAPPLASLAHSIVMVALFVQAALWGDLAVKEWLRRYRARATGEHAASTTSTAALGFVVRAIIWLVMALMILDNFGVNITTLVASLGIGGIAVALALQNILGDLFSSLSIVLDKPFVVGDFISVDGVSGTVEYVGLKTTRIRALGGEQIVFSNSDMLNTRIHNYKRMQTRRISFVIGVTYETAQGKLQGLSQMIGEIVQRQQGVSFDRAHFKGFAASSLDFEVVYIVNSADYRVYMDVQQAINLELFACFARESIAFAYPTQTIHHVHADPAPARQEAGRDALAHAAMASARR